MSNTKNQGIALVTGATSGLGRATAEALADRGWTVLVHGRNRDRAEELAARLTKRGAESQAYVADFGSLEEVAVMGRQITNEHPGLHLLINNAGVGAGAPGGRREIGTEGYELRLTVNYLAPVLLTRLLRGALKAGRPAQVLNIGSVGMSVVDFKDPQMTRGYSGMGAYTASKWALAAFTFAAAKQYADDGVNVNCIHPATYMDTGMVRESGVRPWTSVDEGLRAVLRAVESGATQTGRFYDGTHAGKGHSRAHDSGSQQRLAELTAQLLGTVPGVEHAAW